MSVITSSFRNIWRPTYEINAAIAWSSAAFVTMTFPMPNTAYAISGCMGLALLRARQAWAHIKFRIGIDASWLHLMHPEALLEKYKIASKQDSGFWLGTGFEWTQQHVQTATEILRMDPKEIDPFPFWFPESWKTSFQPKDMVKDKNAIGASWIHGIGRAEEKDIVFTKSARAGHTLIVGTTGSGKTKNYEVLTMQAIHSGGVVIVVDPKGDKDWQYRMRRECKRAGREFLYFNPAVPSKSIRLNPIKNWNNPSEVASRISQLLSTEGGGDSFVKFAHLTIDRVVNGQLFCGERPDLRKIRDYIQGGVEPLLQKCFESLFEPVFGSGWDAKLAPYIEKAASRTHAMIQLYQNEKRLNPALFNEAIDGLVSTFTHDKEHFGKMILSLLPLLQMLCSGEIGELLSPDGTNFEDTRAIWDMKKIVQSNKVLYVGLDSLSNQSLCSAIGSILLADTAAVAGDIYNFGEEQDIYLFVDEAAEVVNDQLIQLLNKGRGAGFKVFFATQTIADFEARFGKKSKALQMLGNANNLICLRVRDWETAKFVADIFGETTIKTASVSHSIGSETEATVTEFRGNVSKSVKDEKAPVIAPNLLLKIPNLQYFAVFAGGKVRKGRLPIILKD